MNGKKEFWCFGGDHHGGVDIDISTLAESGVSVVGNAAAILLARNELRGEELTLLPYLAYALNVRRAVDILADLCRLKDPNSFPKKDRCKDATEASLYINKSFPKCAGLGGSELSGLVYLV